MNLLLGFLFGLIETNIYIGTYLPIIMIIQHKEDFCSPLEPQVKILDPVENIPFLYFYFLRPKLLAFWIKLYSDKNNNISGLRHLKKFELLLIFNMVHVTCR